MVETFMQEEKEVMDFIQTLKEREIRAISTRIEVENETLDPCAGYRHRIRELESVLKYYQEFEQKLFNSKGWKFLQFLRAVTGRKW